MVTLDTADLAALLLPAAAEDDIRDRGPHGLTARRARSEVLPEQINTAFDLMHENKSIRSVMVYQK